MPEPAVPAAALSSHSRERLSVRRALVSVYDKSGLVELGRALAAADIEIVSTGSTAARLEAVDVPVTRVESVTGFPELLDGRVKTLHPRIHGGLLADRRRSEHVAALADHGIAPFDLVVVNLYPFSATVASGAGEEECVELIDIGGPAMVRAAAKNYANVAVVVDPATYPELQRTIAEGGTTLAQRRELAAQAFRHTARYDTAVASWLAQRVEADSGDEGVTRLPAVLGEVWERTSPLRYGENPHQAAALYTAGTSRGLAGARTLHGKPMSYNNYVDADAAWRAAWDHAGPAVAIIKHANPCGIAAGEAGAPIADVYSAAHACDPVSAFGGVIAVNRPVTAAMAERVAQVFTEVLLAPAFEPEALEILTRKKNLRLLEVAPPARGEGALEQRAIDGGLLVQQRDLIDASVPDGGDLASSWRLAAGAAADAETLGALQFAWRAVRAVKSNAILLADLMEPSAGEVGFGPATGTRVWASVGVGMGQVNRVDSCRLAVERANTHPAERARGAVAASDAFFPFADGLEVLLAAGVRAVVQPGGSVRDAEVIAAAEAAGVTLYLTGVRHFAH